MKKIVKNVGLLSLVTLGAISVASCKKTQEQVDWLEVDKNVTVSAKGDRKSYSSASYTEREKILGLLEKYAIENNLTGLTLYGDGSWARYNSRITSPTNWHYVNGYGYGILTEGSITAPLAGESNPKFVNYYHSYEQDKPSTLNYMNSKESVTSDLLSNVAGSYFGNKLVQKDDGSYGYAWDTDLAVKFDASYKNNKTGLTETEHNALLAPAKELDADGKSTDWKIKVKTDEVTYSTLSTKDGIKDFNGRKVAKEDYLVPYMLYFSQYLGFARSTETFGSSSALKGGQEYYNLTKDADTFEKMKSAWDKTLGKYIYFDDEGYLHFSFTVSKTKFYAMYNLNSNMYAPIPQSFLEKIGMKNWGNSTDDGLTPVDTYLSTGPYTVETWSNTELTFKRNSRVVDYAPYHIEGIKYAILEAAKSDTLAAYKEYEANKLDVVGIPSEKLDTDKSKSDAHQSGTSTTYKINYNTCDAETWEALFGENGTITKTAKENYWELKPAMQNNKFVQALSLALDRKTFADTYGRGASAEYFGDSYLSNPEEGIIYNETETHKNAAKAIYPTEQAAKNYGFDKAKAQELFSEAAEELTSAGLYNSGDTVTIEVAWQSESQKTTQGATLKQMFESAFNTSEANTKYGLTLNVENVAMTIWSDVYYKKMMVGQFDLAFGSISGNALDPLNFLEVLKSDNSSGFTLNWGTDTNTVDSTMYYDGQTWSFDALWQAADSSALVLNGKRVNYVDTKVSKSHHNEDGTRQVVVKYAKFTGDDYRANFTTDDLSIVWYDAEGAEHELTADEAHLEYNAGQITFVLPEEVESSADQVVFALTFNVEKKVNGEWIVAESGKSEVGNTITFSPKNN
ncbi:MAG: hypothetical protein K6G28_06485 [Acholeplasmatales bacterium]|nr:hypothetical protein [Acholeplasmatales bacterium]